MSRPKGAKNKQPLGFREALRKYCDDRGVNPHYWMADLLTRKGVRLELKIIAAKELARYLEPQLKSIDVQGVLDNPSMARSVDGLLEWFKGMSDLELRNLQKELAARSNGHSTEDPLE